MKSKVLIFTKIPQANGGIQILFALNGTQILETSFNQISFNDFAQDKNFIRHHQFDGYFNQQPPFRFLVEYESSSQESLFCKIQILEKIFQINWNSFHECARILRDGKQRNFIQLAVQYLANNGMHDDVIAADLDEAFIKSLQKE